MFVILIFLLNLEAVAINLAILCFALFILGSAQQFTNLSQTILFYCVWIPCVIAFVASLFSLLSPLFAAPARIEARQFGKAIRVKTIVNMAVAMIIFMGVNVIWIWFKGVT